MEFLRIAQLNQSVAGVECVSVMVSDSKNNEGLVCSSNACMEVYNSSMYSISFRNIPFFLDGCAELIIGFVRTCCTSGDALRRGVLSSACKFTVWLSGKLPLCQFFS